MSRNRAIFTAINENNPTRLKSLLKGRSSIEATNASREVPIVYAAKLRRLECLSVIIEFTERLEIDENTQALCLAIEAMDLPRIRQILKKNISLWNLGEKQFPMQRAVELGLWECVDLIANKETDTLGIHKFDIALYKAVIEDRLETVKLLIKAKARAHHTRESDGASLLHIAVENNNFEMVSELADYTDNHFGYGSFNNERSCGYKEYTQMYGKNQSGQTAFQLAIDLGHWDCAKTLAISGGTFPDYDDMPTLLSMLMHDVKVRNQNRITPKRNELLDYILNLPDDKKDPALKKGLDESTDLCKLLLGFEQASLFDKIFHPDQSSEGVKARMIAELQAIQNRREAAVNLITKSASSRLFSAVPKGEIKEARKERKKAIGMM